jgi:hypothetical protein
MMVPAGIYHSRYAKDGSRRSRFASLTTLRDQVKESIYRNHAKHDGAKQRPNPTLFIGLEDSSGTRGVVHFVHDAFGSLIVIIMRLV